MSLRQLVRKSLRRAGLDVRRFTPASSEDAALAAMLATHRVDLVLDVGANTGQFGHHLRSAGYRGRIVSFEPLSAARAQLEKTARGDALWELAPQAAIGGEEGSVEIHIAGNSVSSSVLPMLDAHADAAPGSRYVGSETVPLHTLDNAAAKFVKPDSVVFLKIDTQGYEDRVLRGAPRLLERAVGLQLELSFVPLYEGQRLHDDMMAQLRAAGFELWSMSPAFIDPRSGRMLQIDATLFRTRA